MKVNWKHLLLWILSAVLFISILIGSTSCSATYHLERFQAKGGICGKIDTIQVLDSVLIYDEIRDTLMVHYYTKDSLIIINDRVVPKTRYELKTEYKIHRDTIRMQETIVKENTKVEKAEGRKLLVWLAMAFLAVVALYLIKKG